MIVMCAASLEQPNQECQICSCHVAKHSMMHCTHSPASLATATLPVCARLDAVVDVVLLPCIASRRWPVYRLKGACHSVDRCTRPRSLAALIATTPLQERHLSRSRGFCASSGRLSCTAHCTHITGIHTTSGYRTPRLKICSMAASVWFSSHRPSPLLCE